MADRKISEVIQQLLEVIPDRYPHSRKRLEKISRDSLFRAPEIMYESWGSCQKLSIPCLMESNHVLSGRSVYVRS